ncbi:quinolinate synthase NadA [Flavobacterium sp. HXWNR29]|uniref:quinolinate synthase NadA n=1 Tax=Flavobacterium odoriferum TaxID=2946604 RepID=UPI0021CAEBEE|nr:quinolinate synthase NadA [Flavobacterium sp. HXWNR29]MCU4188846.1 quinolinate synthase NadA [Flavobacterium sp. HXWNR29]
MKTTSDLKEKILELKKRKNAVILAHYYQEEAIQEIADFVGDSLELSRKASQVDADIIVFAGVYFMAETAKIVNPNKKVIVPDVKAGCSLADSCQPEDFKTFLAQYPNHTVVTYINCSAEIKTLTDIVCTSSNAKKIIASIPENKLIIFAPDKNLGKYLIAETGREMVLWEGSCIVHEAFSLEKLIDLYKKHPTATIIAHPESETHILKVAHYIGSTSGMLNHVKNSTNDTFIVATEAGILHQMQLDNPTKTLIPAPSKENNTCACSECAFMKVNTLEKLYNCLKKEQPEVKIDTSVIEKALVPIQKMLSIN